MVEEEKQTLLIVEDDLDVAEMVSAYFDVQGYHVHTVNWGEEAIKVCQEDTPDLVILDIRLPDIDGFEVARRLRTNRRTKDIPIIFLTERRGRSDRLKGFEIGADDYLTKPFDVQELRLRVRNALQRSTPGALHNPITNLPEGTLVDERLMECLGAGNWAILVVTLANLERFRETYGFVAADDVLRAITLIINNTAKDSGGVNDFVGHLNPNEFVLVTVPSVLSTLRERIQSRVEQSLDYFYPLKDRERGDVIKDRLAVQIKYLTANDGVINDLDALKARLR